jgi:hypothetical protein
MAAEEASATIAEQESCCFNNPGFTGTCQVVPGEDETCGSILAYLNNPNSVGKAYCGGTKVRGGWSQVACEGGASVGAACSSKPEVFVLPAD